MLEAILTMSLFCCGIYILGEPKMILHKPKSWLKKLLTYEVRYTKAVVYPGEDYRDIEVTEKKTMWIFKALWDCPPCMSSVWGTLVFWSGFSHLWAFEAAIGVWLVSLGAASFLNGLFMGLWNKV